MIEFRPLEDRDLPLVEEWLRRDHVAEWWRDPLEVADEMRRAAAAGEQTVEYYVIVVDGRPAGLIQTYLVADHPEWEAVVQVGPDAAGVDLFIGESDLVGRGLGPEVLAAFVQEVSSRVRERLPRSRRWRRRTAARGAPSRRRASATSATSRRTACPIG